MEKRLEDAPVGVLLAEPDGTVRSVNDAGSELLGVSPAEVTGATVETVLPYSVDATIPRAFESTPVTAESVEEYYPGLERWLAVSLVPGEDVVTVYVRDVSERHRLEQRLRERTADLDQLTVVNQLIADVLAQLIDASSREEIATTICDRLGRTDIYEFAWVGERDLGSDDVLLRASSGTTGRTGDCLEACLDADTAVPERRAMETGHPEIVQPLGEAESVPEQLRRAAFADGIKGLLAIPLTYASSTYGVVGVYTADRDAFSERERESFSTLGEMAGFAINATRNRSLLLTDTIVELTLQVEGNDDPLAAAASEQGATLSVDGFVLQESGLRCYLAVRDADPALVAESALAFSGVGATRVIDSQEDAGTVELALSQETLFGRLASLGVTLKSGEFTADSGEIVVELPPEEDVRRIADSVTRSHDVTVVAKRERERDVTTAREFRDALRERLTERQENALRTAFFADYFESPRGSSAEEVADALGITGSTLLHHLRAGQRKLLEELLAPRDERV